MKILLIEDNQNEAESLTRLITKLSNGEWSVDIQRTLQDGIRASVCDKPDVTYCDALLPDTNGWQEVGDSISQMVPPVIIVTGLVGSEYEEAEVYFYRKGAQHVFQKNRRDMELLVANLMSSGVAAHARRVLGKQPDGR